MRQIGNMMASFMEIKTLPFSPPIKSPQRDLLNVSSREVLSSHVQEGKDIFNLVLVHLIRQNKGETVVHLLKVTCNLSLIIPVQEIRAGLNYYIYICNSEGLFWSICLLGYQLYQILLLAQELFEARTSRMWHIQFG